METKVFLEKLADVLQMSPDDINEQTPIISGIFDSLAVLETISLIDEQFNVTVPTNELTQCASVDAIIRLVQRSLAESADA